jgi:predicted NBD/HSP70 family sugar kinase
VKSKRIRNTQLADQSDLRRHNLRLILQHIFDEGPRSRATISAETGLTRSTVSSLTAELIARGLLVERGLSTGSIGRPSQTLEVSGKRVAFGVEFMVDRVGVCAVDLGGRVRHSMVVRQDHRLVDPGHGVDEIVSLVEAAISVVERRAFKVVGLAVGVPGLVGRDGVVASAPRLGWEAVPLAAMLRARVDRDLPIVVDDAANLAAFAELTEGVGYKFDDFLYLYGDDGIGMGVVVERDLVRGKTGFAGAIGHTVIEPGGLPCVCGNDGCLDTLVSRDALLTAAGLGDGAGESLVDVVERARAGDTRAVNAIETASSVIAATVAPICSVLAPEAIVLGGELAQLAEWLIGDLDDYFAERVLSARWSRCGVVIARVLDQAAARGGAALVLRHIYDDPTVLPRSSDAPEVATPNAEATMTDAGR